MRGRCTSLIQTHQRFQRPAPAANAGTCQPAIHCAAHASRMENIAKIVDDWVGAQTSIPCTRQGRYRVNTEERGAHRDDQSGNTGTRDGRERDSGLQFMNFLAEFTMEGRTCQTNTTGMEDKWLRGGGGQEQISTRIHTHAGGYPPPGRLKRLGAHQ